MEPTICKPGAYKSTGVYNGAGGVYNGRGVYNDGTGGDVFFYDTDFSNFDLDTGEDQGFIWTFYANKSYIEKSDVELNGVIYKSLLFRHGANTQIDFDLDQIPLDVFTAKMSMIVKGSGTSASGGLEYTGCAPYYNLYASDRGIGVKNINLSSLQYYNNFHTVSDAIYSDFYGRFDFDRIIEGGLSVNRTTRRCGFFLFGKKAIEGISSNLNTTFDIYFNNASSSRDSYVTRFQIQEGFLFDELE